MKYVFLPAYFIVVAVSSFGQDMSVNKRVQKDSSNVKGNLEKYVWSHSRAVDSRRDKAVLDFDAIDNWQIVGEDDDFSISPNAQFFAYSIQNTQTRKRDSLIVQATDGSWRQAFPGASPGVFSSDNRLFVFKDKNDLFFLQPGTRRIEKISGVVNWQQPMYKKGRWIAYQLQQPVNTVVLYNLLTGKKFEFNNAITYSIDVSENWLVCQLSNETRELVLYNLQTEEQQRFSSVFAYTVAPAGNSMILQTTLKQDNLSKTSLDYINLADKTSKNIWSTTDTSSLVKGFAIDPSGIQVVFMVQDTSPAIWYYHTGMEKAILKVNQQTAGMDLGYNIAGPPYFTNDGCHIQFYISAEPAILPQANPDAAKIDIWSHKDAILRVTQPWQLKQPPSTYVCIIHPQRDRMIRLEQPFERYLDIRKDFAVVLKRGRDVSDRFWEKDYNKDSTWLVELKNGSRNLLKTDSPGSTWFSPDGNYVVYFDRDKQCNYFSVHLATGKVSRISAGIPVWQLGIDKGGESSFSQPLGNDREAGVAAWLEKDRGVLVYDEFYDIWQLDLAGKKTPINITSAIARQQHVRLMLPQRGFEVPTISEKDTLLLRAFNTQSKQSGFFKKILGNTKMPQLLFIGNCMLEPILAYSKTSNGIYRIPLKAAEANVWIVKRQRTDEAPNYQLTKDFKAYTTLTDIQPQKKYNWVTADLHSFKQKDGIKNQGILYKPENFDSTKKYPVIVYTYGTLTNLLHEYRPSAYMRAPQIPSPGWLTSHGYLVFTPDVYYKKGQWGPSGQNAYDGAARYLSGLPYVDGSRIGGCGHSNSGRTAYYVLTHSSSFAAMCIGAGQTNIIESALSTSSNVAVSGSIGKEASILEYIEENDFGTGLGPLWQNKQTWLDQTAVLHADKANSPLLMFHNSKDGAAIRQPMEMFIALRRLEKLVWWLDYNESAHVTRLLRDSKDFTIRFTQFFDHYLKGAPPPRWMTEGIPLKEKGVEAKYELDVDGSCGRECKICKEKSYDLK